MTYKIDSALFWFQLRHLYPLKDQDYHLMDEPIQKISRSVIGLEFIKSDFSDDISQPYATDYVFKIIDKQKLTWAKVAYGI